MLNVLVIFKIFVTARNVTIVLIRLKINHITEVDMFML